MFVRNTLAASITAVVLLTAATGCAVHRDQSSTGQYVDDTAITASVKSRFIESKEVAASSIQVETLKGTVQLAGFAKSADEKAAAERIATKVNGVKSVKNDIIVRP
jgi:hyperosmotically inducible periplasmic protein